MTLYKQTTYIKVNNKYQWKIIDKYSIYEMHNSEQTFDFDSFVEFLETNSLPYVRVYTNWRKFPIGLEFRCPYNKYHKKDIQNIKLYTVTETVDTRNYRIDDLRKWLNADEFIEYITCVRLDMNEFIN